MQLQLFKYQSEEEQSFNQVRTVLIDDEPYFVGKDVAGILGYSNTNDALINHVDEDDKQLLQLSDLQEGRETLPSHMKSSKIVVVNESGLYSLVFGSKLDSAKAFKRWVTDSFYKKMKKNLEIRKICCIFVSKLLIKNNFMKFIKILFTFLLVSITCSAQLYEKPVVYSFNAESGGTLYFSYYNADKLEVTTSHGINLYDQAFIGIGVGYNYYKTPDVGVRKHLIPLFADLRSDLYKTDGRVVPLIGIKGGYTFDTSCDNSHKLGWFINPFVGVKVRTEPEGSVYFTVGYSAQWVDSYKYTAGKYRPYHENIDGLSFKIGYEF